MTPEPLLVLGRVPLSQKQCETFATLAHLCCSQFNLPRAGQALERLVLDRSLVLPAARWLPKSTTYRPPLPSTDNPFFPHLPPTSWRLLARV